MSVPKVNASELTTAEGVVGHNDYIVNIQKFFDRPDREQRLIYSVGVLVDVQFVLASCSIFYEAAIRNISPEKQKYKAFRIVADGVTGHMHMILDGRKLRFIDHVALHPNCKMPDPGQNKWKSDLAIVHMSFPITLQPGSVGMMKFGHVQGGAKQLMRNRTLEFAEFHRQHRSVVQLGKKSPVCRVMSWGRRETVMENTDKYEFHASPKLLLYRVKLADEKDCEVFCSEDDRFCLTNNTDNSTVVCAYRGNVTFSRGGRDYSAYPCIGTEGSPLICHPPDKREKADIYGIVASIPSLACIRRSWPITITHIEDVSRFVLDEVGRATELQSIQLMMLLSCVFSALVSI